MAITRKHKAMERIQALLEVYQVLDSTIYLDDHTYSTHERSVREALRELEKCDVSLPALQAIWRLLDGALSQALNRDPSLPWIVGARKVSGTVGEIK